MQPSDNAMFGVWKPAGIRSFDVIRRLRRLLPGVKMGHAGTLDPFASGVLVLATGRETKHLAQVVGAEKEYLAEVVFGVLSTTYDPEGELVAVWPKLDAERLAQWSAFWPGFVPPRERKDFRALTRGEVETVVRPFVGDSDQLPPAFSAKKVGGVRAYAAARAGKVVVLQPKRVHIAAIEILDWQWPVLRLRVVCGSGTYIRSLGYDIGRVLGCGAYVRALTRTRVGNFTLKTAITIA